MASTKLDNRGAFGSKRSRNDAASQTDGDWICLECGNVNFSFRTVCNRAKCGAARPSASPRIGATPVHDGYDNPMAPYYGGVGAPPLMPYGMSGGYGGPPLSIPGMHYDYGPPGSALGSYGPLSSYGPSIPLGGMGYGPGLGMDRYGYGYRGSPLVVPGPWSGGALLDNNASRKRRGGPDGLQEGDWVCPKCDNVNFAFRTTCNMKKCGAPKPTPASSRAAGDKDNSVPEGSWTCSKCNNLNYPFRTVCNRKGCGSEKPSTS